MQTYKLKHQMISLISLFYKFCEHSLLPGTGHGTQRRNKSVPSSEDSCLSPPTRRHLTIAHLLVSMVSWDWINWKRLFIKQYVLTCADLVVALEVLSVFLLYVLPFIFILEIADPPLFALESRVIIVSSGKLSNAFFKIMKDNN